MPLRDYGCRICHSEWEELRKDQTDPLRCPTCNCDTVERKLSLGGLFTFEHGGFKQDYIRSKNG